MLRIAPMLPKEYRPLVVTASVVAETKAALADLLAWTWLPALSREEAVEERWREVIRRCNGWPLSLRDAAFLVLDEWRRGTPTCWIR